MTSATKKRKYIEEYINFGFTNILSSGIEKPQCVVCNDVLSVESMKPNKLKRHLETKHLQFVNEEPEFFKNKAEKLKRSRLDYGGAIQQQTKAALTVSYNISLRIAKAKKSLTLAEEVIMPCARDIVHYMFGDDAVKKLNPISLSNDTVYQRISEMSDDILIQVINEMKAAPLGIFALQLDESTDVINSAQLLVYVRYINNNDLKDEFLFCKPLETTTTALDVFEKIGSFLEGNKLEWANVCGTCTDGSPAMLGCRSGFQQLVKKVSPQNVGIHCMIHRQVLAARTLPGSLKNLMDLVVKRVNFIKANGLNSRLFSKLCQEMGSTYAHKSKMVIQGQNAATNLRVELSRYFPDAPQISHTLAKNPFVLKVESVPENWQEEFIDLINSDCAKTDFQCMTISQFWVKQLSKYPTLSETVLRVLMPFPTTYIV